MEDTAYITISRIAADRNGTCFVEGYAGDTDAETLAAFAAAQKTHATGFKEAAYLVDLFRAEGEMTDTFAMTEAGLLALTSPVGKAH